MRLIVIGIFFLGAFNYSTYGQGDIAFCNTTAPTRLYTPDGPLAGPNIWGHFLLGMTVEELAPADEAKQHGAGGTIAGCRQNVVDLPNLDPGDIVYMQMTAWDGDVWGNALEGVPEHQLGFTDIVPVMVGSPTQPASFPLFTQPAVVPLIPEPSLWVLSALWGIPMLLFRHLKKAMKLKPEDHF